tara:strand:- start:1609 stop:2193 length:585 start_codon:yes stop_codon:yes gene_type:complete
MELKVKKVKRIDGVREALYLPALFVGFRLTIKHFWRNLFGSKDVVTINYPEEKRNVSERWRGRHRLTRRENGFLSCVACYMCETVCPSKCIHIEAGEHPDLSIEKYPVVFNIDELRCVFCGLCVEACPKDAIRMDTGVISMAHTSRHAFDFTRDLLRDAIDPEDQPNPKYDENDIPSPSEKKDALPNSQGVPAS